MVLAADIGNSNVVIGCFEGNEIKFIERLSTNRNSTALEYAVLIKTVLELNGCAHTPFEGGIVSSVVPALTNVMRQAIEKLIGKPPIITARVISLPSFLSSSVFSFTESLIYADTFLPSIILYMSFSPLVILMIF